MAKYQLKNHAFPAWLLSPVPMQKVGIGMKRLWHLHLLLILRLSVKLGFMRTVVQRVTEASVTIDGKLKSTIGKGLLLLLGIEDADNTDDIQWLCNKIVNLRIFDDEEGVPNISVKDINGEILVVSQFTLHASTKKGNRPSYIRASKPPIAIPLYEAFIKQLQFELGKPVGTGEFGADMKVSLLNDGPVTIIIDTKNKDF